MDAKMYKILVHWITERESIRRLKEAGKPKPWTKDIWLRAFKFCNVRRIDDRVSQWLLQHWYMRSAPARITLLAAALGRLINWPDALACCTSLPFKKWKPQEVEQRLEACKAGGHKVFTGAYIVNGAAGGSKIAQVVRHVDGLARTKPFTKIWRPSYRETCEVLAQQPGFGSFMAGQVATDLHYVHPFSDGETWAPIGPGSRRGMRRLLGLDATGTMTQREFDPLLEELYTQLDIDDVLPEHTSFMDVQNCLCEFDKYVRLTQGGHVRSRYPGAA